MERLVEVEKLTFDSGVELSLRPDIWEEYIGQEKIKRNLRVYIDAALKRQDVLDHVLFYGPPGLGKTTISYLIATQMQANIKVTAGPMIEKSGDLAAILTNLSEGDILFIDEIHRLRPNIEEVLYSAMEDYRLDIVIGSGPAAQTVKVDLPKFTLVGATTRAGMLSAPLKARFGIEERMQFYSDTELSKIVIQASYKLDKPTMKDAAFEIARRSRGTPRIALRLLRRVRDFAEVENEIKIELERTQKALVCLGVNDNGFDDLDIRLLELLTQKSGSAVGLSSIAAALSEDEGTVEDVLEPYLLANGYIERTHRGRIATEKTYRLFKLPLPRQKNSEGTLF
jgi:holliday junction DNA helicase RuvB